MPDDATEAVAEHSSRLQPSINLHAPVTAFMFSCSGTQYQYLVLIFEHFNNFHYCSSFNNIAVFSEGIRGLRDFEVQGVCQEHEGYPK